MWAIFVMLNNFFHDLAVGLLAANLFVVYFYRRHARGTQLEALQGALVTYMRRITWFTLGWILIGGAIRALCFMEFEWNPAVGRGQVPALVIKHIVLFSVVVYGLLVQRRLFAMTSGGGQEQVLEP